MAAATAPSGASTPLLGGAPVAVGTSSAAPSVQNAPCVRTSIGSYAPAHVVDAAGAWTTHPPMPTMTSALHTVGATGTALMQRPPDGRKLTEGLPDPNAIEAQKQSYEKALDASLEQQQKMAVEQVKRQKEALKLAAQQQLAMYKAQMEQTIRQHELALDQQLHQSQMEMQQHIMQQKSALEQQASALAMEYKQRKMHDEMLTKQAEMEAEMQKLQAKMHQEMAQHHQEHTKMQQQHAIQQQAQQQQLSSQQQAQHVQLHDQMQKEMLSQQQQLGHGCLGSSCSGIPVGSMHMGVPGSMSCSSMSMPTEHPINSGVMRVPSVATNGSVGSMAPIVSQSVTRVVAGGAATPGVPGGSVVRLPSYTPQSMPASATYGQPVSSVGSAAGASGGAVYASVPPGSVSSEPAQAT